MSDDFLHGTVHTAGDDLQSAVRADPVVLARWQALTPLGRNEFICWVEDAKQAPTRQRRIEPLWKRIGGNCHLTRPIGDAYEQAGFAVERQGAAYMPKSPRPFGWVEFGAARVAS